MVALRALVLGNTAVDTAGAAHRMWDSEDWLWVPLLGTRTILDLGLHLIAAWALPRASISWLHLPRGPESTDTKQSTHFKQSGPWVPFKAGENRKSPAVLPQTKSPKVMWKAYMPAYITVWPHILPATSSTV